MGTRFRILTNHLFARTIVISFIVLSGCRSEEDDQKVKAIYAQEQDRARNSFRVNIDKGLMDSDLIATNVGEPFVDAAMDVYATFEKGSDRQYHFESNPWISGATKKELFWYPPWPISLTGCRFGVSWMPSSDVVARLKKLGETESSIRHGCTIWGVVTSSGNPFR